MSTCKYSQEKASSGPLWSQMVDNLESMCYDDSGAPCNINKCKGQLDCPSQDHCTLNCTRKNKDAFFQVQLNGSPSFFKENLQCADEVGWKFQCSQQPQCGTVRLLDFNEANCDVNHKTFQENRVMISCSCRVCECSTCGEKACSCRVVVGKAPIIDTGKQLVVNEVTGPTTENESDLNTTSEVPWTVGSTRMSQFSQNSSPMTGAIVGSIVPILLIIVIVLLLVLRQRKARAKLNQAIPKHGNRIRFTNAAYDQAQNINGHSKELVCQNGQEKNHVNNVINESTHQTTKEQYKEPTYDVVTIHEKDKLFLATACEQETGNKNNDYCTMSSHSENKNHGTANDLRTINERVSNKDNDYSLCLSSNPYQNQLFERQANIGPKLFTQDELSKKAGYETMRCSYDANSPALLNAVEGDCKLEYDTTYCFSPKTPVSVEHAWEQSIPDSLHHSITIIEPLDLDVKETAMYNRLNSNKKKTDADRYDRVRNIVEANPYSNVENAYDTIRKFSKVTVLLHPGYDNFSLNESDVDSSKISKESPYANMSASNNSSKTTNIRSN